MSNLPVPPFRYQFDMARYPRDARIALGIIDAGIAGFAEYSYSSNTTAPPANGQIRGNNATAASVTAIYVSNITNGGVDIKRIVGAWPSGSTFVVQDKNDSANYAKFQSTAIPTDNGTYWTIPVSFIAGAGTVNNNELVLLAKV